MILSLWKKIWTITVVAVVTAPDDCRIGSYLILSYLILSYLILSYLIWSDLIWSDLIAWHRMASHRIASHSIESHHIVKSRGTCRVNLLPIVPAEIWQMFTRLIYRAVTKRDNCYKIVIMVTLLRRNINHYNDHIHTQSFKMPRSGHPFVTQENTQKFLIIANALCRTSN